MSGRLRIIMEGDSKELEDIMRTVFAKRQAIEAEVRETGQTIDAFADLTRVLKGLAEFYGDEAKQTTLTTEAEWQTLMAKVDAWKRETKMAEIKAKITIRNSLLALRSMVDAMNFLSAFAGEHVETHFLSMISMGFSAALQIKLQAAVYAATPGMQPMALMLLSLLPVLTGMMLWQRAEMLKWTTKIAEQNNADWDSLLGGI